MFFGPSFSKQKIRPVEDIRPKIELIKSKPERLLLVDNDLYNFDSGELIFRGYVKEGMPAGLWLDVGEEKLIARYPKGFTRLNLAGQEETRLQLPHGGAFSDELKWVLFGRNKDIWQADIDWKLFKAVNERQVTDASMFMDSRFVDSVVFGSDSTLVMRHLNKLLRVEMAGGKIVETKLPLENITKRLAPDFKHVVGFNGGQFYWYDLDADQTKTIRIPKGMVRDYQWLGPSRCAVLHSENEVGMFNLEAETLELVLRLPSVCANIAGPSPDGRHVFCFNSKQGFLVDLETKTVIEMPPGEGFFWVGNDALLLRREGVDSERRGTWLYTIGKGEKRISPEAYVVQKGAPSVLWLEKAGVLVMGMSGGLWSANADGREAKERIKLARPPEMVLTVGKWSASP